MKRFKIALPRRKTPFSTGCIVDLKLLAIVFGVLFVFVLAPGVCGQTPHIEWLRQITSPLFIQGRDDIAHGV